MEHQQQQFQNIEHDKVWVQKSGGVTDQFNLGDVQVRRIEVNRVEEIRALNLRLAEAEEKILEAERLRKDEAILASEARKLAETSCMNATKASEVVTQQEQFKQQFLSEEADFERQRSLAHERAVNAENARANARAEQILYEEQEKEAFKLVHKHELQAEHAAKIAKAYELVKQECERRRWMLQSDMDIEVTGVLPHERPTMAQIRVEVQPQAIPESQRLPTTGPHPTAKLAEVVEHLPRHAPIHVEPQQAAAKIIREDVQTINVNREEAVLNTAKTSVVRQL